MRKIIDTINLFRNLIAPESYLGYAGATTNASDARKLYSFLQQGDNIIEGPYIEAYEKQLSSYFGGMHVTSFGSGRVALYAILKAMDFKKDSEIILPGYTCIVTSNAIQHAGLIPVYVDVNERNGNILSDKIASSITSRTAAIIAQHTFGIPCDIEAILDISKRHGIPMIEDGAHALGASWDGKLVGKWGQAAFFSTQMTKMLSTERGGFVTTSDNQLANRIRQVWDEASYRPFDEEKAAILRWCLTAYFSTNPKMDVRCRAMSAILRAFGIKSLDKIFNYDAKEYKDSIACKTPDPYPSRLSNIFAYSGILQLARFEKELAHRRELAAFLEEQLQRISIKTFSYEPKRALPSWVRFPFLVEDRKDFIPVIKQAGLMPGTWLNDPIHPENSNSIAAGYKRGSCPNAEYISKHILNIPVDSRVNFSHINNLLKKMKAALKLNSN